jgi:hypothetical protein
MAFSFRLTQEYRAVRKGQRRTWLGTLERETCPLVQAGKNKISGDKSAEQGEDAKTNREKLPLINGGGGAKRKRCDYEPPRRVAETGLTTAADGELL